jgi:hypothetical protein
MHIKEAESTTRRVQPRLSGALGDSRLFEGIVKEERSTALVHRSEYVR